MRTTIPRLSREFVLAGLLVSFGLAAAWFAKDYPMGNLRDMGPGYLPFHLGLLIAAMGVLVAAMSLNRTGDARAQPRAEESAAQENGDTPLRAVLAAPVAVLLFGFAVERLGLVVAILLATGTMGLAWPQARRREAVTVAVVLAVAITLLFPVLLRVPLPIWPSP
ncbi:MAG: tripartite tricarboxylate transporter TctB family protein [Moraxellaceae bacterium]|nr:tripartite tricarboxylate transporter TctB family protein [Moraxellaceae bacterium]